MIKFLDNYVQKINKQTVVVIDNAPIHRSKAFEKKISEWQPKKLEIFWLPTYSPYALKDSLRLCLRYPLGLEAVSFRTTQFD